MHIAELCFCGDRIDLAHISSFIFFLYVVNMQKPCPMLIVFIMCNADTWISCDYMIVHGQNGWLLEMDPRHLFLDTGEKKDGIYWKITGLNRYVIRYYCKLVNIGEGRVEWFELINRFIFIGFDFRFGVSYLTFLCFLCFAF